MDDQDASLILLDVLRGYSVMTLKEEEVYLKHFTILEYSALDEYEKRVFDAAVKKGIKTEAQIIERSISLGSWSQKKEDDLTQSNWTIQKSREASVKIKDERQRAQFLKTIEADESLVDSLNRKKKELTEHSAENYAAEKRFKRLLDSLIFKDKDFLEKLDVGKEDQSKILGFVELSKFFDRDTLLKAAYSPQFFNIYALQYRSPFDILGKTITEMTLFQSRLLSSASALFGKIRSSSEIPDHIMEDPIKLYEFEEGKVNDKKTTEGFDDLKLKMKAKGKITSEDLLS